MSIEWTDTTTMPPKKYTCYNCGSLVASNKGFFTKGTHNYYIYICPNCIHPTYFWGSAQIPSPSFGNTVEHLPEKVEALYEETRECTSALAYTSAVLACRKLLMNIAVQQGAKEGKTYLEYVEYLSKEGYVPPQGKAWVDLIRTKGNEANHEIKLMQKEDAEQLITFLEMLLKFIYEFPGKIGREAPNEQQTS